MRLPWPCPCKRRVPGLRCAHPGLPGDTGARCRCERDHARAAAGGYRGAHRQHGHPAHLCQKRRRCVLRRPRSNRGSAPAWSVRAHGEGGHDDRGVPSRRSRYATGNRNGMRDAFDFALRRAPVVHREKTRTSLERCTVFAVLPTTSGLRRIAKQRRRSTRSRLDAEVARWSAGTSHKLEAQVSELAYHWGDAAASYEACVRLNPDDQDARLRWRRMDLMLGRR